MFMGFMPEINLCYATLGLRSYAWYKRFCTCNVQELIRRWYTRT